MNGRFEKYIEALTPKKRELVCEAVSEYLKGEAENDDRIDDAYKVFVKMRYLALESEEHAYVVLANRNFRFIKSVCVGKGSQTETLFDVRRLLREALINKATALYICHNHPSGSTKPSKDDDMFTNRVKSACDIMGIRMVDHVIIADGNYYSYYENGRL